ncbi:MAG: ASKHA domain-containing protein [Acidobacteriota bacterium]|nr:ASKHA domain-containing protein [Acidobacteriota bacterium]MDH3523602.1 ASKHA domain-containing protein [Acidobacteriota bacterium]
MDAASLSIDGREGALAAGESIFRAAERLGLHVPTSCHEQGKCRECLVEIESGGAALTARAAEEEHLPARFRLACRARRAGPGPVAAHTMRRGALRIEEGSRGLDAAAELDPRYRRRGTVLTRDGRAVGTIAGPPLGVAVDLGTTTVVLGLVDLESGALVATQSFENPQRFGGSDVMARIRYDGDHRGRLLQRVLLGYLGRALASFPAAPETIVELVVAGNPTMRDLLFGLDVHPIGQLPYRSRTEHELAAGVRATTSLEAPARALRLPLHPAATVYGLPLVASHVGADAAACLLATGIAERDGVAMCMDVGTNTEVLIGHRGRILAASCPAGPAFEGGGVRCGMPGLEGAIERVRLRSNGAVEYEVIGGGPPLGICGSGLVDLVSELARTGRMSAQGRFTGDDGDGTFTVDAAHGIVLTEHDVNELAQAKGANAAGVRIVADRFGVDLARVERFYLAGGFGRHLDAAAARRIGLIPDLPPERIVQVGNASLAGAARVLRSRGDRSRLEALVRRVEHVALESHPAFFDCFVDGCQFVPFGGGGAT